MNILLFESCARWQLDKLHSKSGFEFLLRYGEDGIERACSLSENYAMLVDQNEMAHSEKNELPFLLISSRRNTDRLCSVNSARRTRSLAFWLVS